MKQYLIPLLGLICLNAQAIKVVEKEVPEITKEAQSNDYLYVSLNIGLTFASHLWSGSDTSTSQELSEDAKIPPRTKAGFNIGYRWDEGYMAEIEYMWHPVSYNYSYLTNSYNSDGARLDLLFVNGKYESSFFSTEYHPYVGLGMGFIFAKLNTSLDGGGGSASKNSADTSLGMQIKVGYNKDLSEGMSYGVSYGYIRSINDVSMTYSYGSEEITNSGTYATQFITVNYALRF